MYEVNYLQVNIGFSRKRGDGTTAHFSPEEARGFVERVKEKMEEYCHWVEVHYGEGSWDGSSERSAHLSSYRFREELYRDDLIDLEAELRYLAEAYGQAAIGLITSSELIEPRD